VPRRAILVVICERRTFLLNAEAPCPRAMKRRVSRWLRSVYDAVIRVEMRADRGFEGHPSPSLRTDAR
jgi:hypothetical protein